MRISHVAVYLGTCVIPLSYGAMGVGSSLCPFGGDPWESGKRMRDLDKLREVVKAKLDATTKDQERANMRLLKAEADFTQLRREQTSRVRATKGVMSPQQKKLMRARAKQAHRAVMDATREVARVELLRAKQVNMVSLAERNIDDAEAAAMLAHFNRVSRRAMPGVEEMDRLTEDVEDAMDRAVELHDGVGTASGLMSDEVQRSDEKMREETETLEEEGELSYLDDLFAETAMNNMPVPSRALPSISVTNPLENEVRMLGTASPDDRDDRDGDTDVPLIRADTRPTRGNSDSLFASLTS